jgi:hypothetical protein
MDDFDLTADDGGVLAAYRLRLFPIWMSGKVTPPGRVNRNSLPA